MNTTFEGMDTEFINTTTLEDISMMMYWGMQVSGLLLLFIIGLGLLANLCLLLAIVTFLPRSPIIACMFKTRLQGCSYYRNLNDLYCFTVLNVELTVGCNFLAGLLLWAGYPEPACNLDDADCGLNIVQNIFYLTSLDNFVVITMYNLTVYFVTDKGRVVPRDHNDNNNNNNNNNRPRPVNHKLLQRRFRVIEANEVTTLKQARQFARQKRKGGNKKKKKDTYIT